MRAAPPPPRSGIRIVLAVLAVLAAPVVGGCAAGPDAPDLRRTASDATGVEGAIRFRVSGAPTDVADDVAAGSSLAVESVVREALRHDPRVQVAIARARAALADARQARLLPNPLLTVMVRFPDGGGADPMIEAGLMGDVLSILTQPRRVSAADRRMRAAAAEALAAVLDVLAETRQQYAAAQAADARVTVLEARRKAAAELVSITQGLVKSGESAPADLLAAEAEADKLEAEHIQELAMARAARLALARLVGRPSSPADWRLDPLADSPAAPAAGDERAWVELALRRRPEVQAARWSLAAAGDDVAVAAAESFGGLDAGATAETEDGDWSGGPAVSVPLPLFDWGGERGRKAKLMQVEARHRYTAARRQAVEDVRRALVDVAATRAALDIVRDRRLPRLRQRRERLEAAFKSGATGIAPVIEAEQDLQEAISGEIDLAEKAAAALIRLHRAAGGPGASTPLLRPATRPTAPVEQ